LVLFYAFYAWWIHFPQSGALAEEHRCVIIPPGVLQVLQLESLLSMPQCVPLP
jgi:hypothetical protein